MYQVIYNDIILKKKEEIHGHAIHVEQTGRFYRGNLIDTKR